MSPPVRAVLFDLDGVLVDSYEVWHRLVDAAARHFGAEPVSASAFRSMWGQGVDADARALRCSLHELERFYNRHFMSFGDALTIDPAAATVLERLHRAGLETAVITNTPAELARQILTVAALDPRVLVGGTDVPRPKPAPDMVRKACALLDVEPRDAIVVGDSDFDRRAAAASGARFVGLRLDGRTRLERLADLPRWLGL